MKLCNRCEKPMVLLRFHDEVIGSGKRIPGSQQLIWSCDHCKEWTVAHPDEPLVQFAIQKKEEEERESRLGKHDHGSLWHKIGNIIVRLDEIERKMERLLKAGSGEMT